MEEPEQPEFRRTSSNEFVEMTVPTTIKVMLVLLLVMMMVTMMMEMMMMNDDDNDDGEDERTSYQQYDTIRSRESASHW